MDIDQVRQSNQLIDERSDLLVRLKLLKRMRGFPIGSLTYYNNSSIKVTVGIPSDGQPLVEEMMRTLLQSEVAQIETQLRAFGVNVGEQNA